MVTPDCTADLFVAPHAGGDPRLAAVLGRYLPRWAALRILDAGGRFVVLAPGQRYQDASPAMLRLGADVDAWPVPPAGLTVCEERAVYLRSIDCMTVTHEAGHLLDLALAGPGEPGFYRSFVDPTLRAGFAAARRFVTPYAATGLDEWFAEGFRAWVGANEPASPWPDVSRDLLADRAAPLFDLFASLEAAA